jgi:predicted MFS family arabinose efflux permease
VITGNLIGSSLAGVVGDLLGWRGVFFVITGLGVLALGVAIVTLREAARVKPAGLSLSGFSAGYGKVFANPRAKVCFSAVFVEGIVVFGLFPFVALLLLAAGEPRASIAGLVIAGFSGGGVIYALLVPRLVARWRPEQMMIGGGVIAAFSLAIVSFDFAWPVQLAAFTLLGFGFYTLHASIQVQATELSPEARGAAMSMHSFFFFVGHASGPVLYGLGFMQLGSALTIALAALVVMGVGFACARLLRERPAG